MSVGDTTGEVLITCGPPSLREVTGSVTEGMYEKRTTDKEQDRPATQRTHVETSERVETWYYNGGEHGFIDILSFRGGVLVKIEHGGRGSGVPDWERNR